MATSTRSFPTDSPVPYFQPIERGYMSEGSQEGVYATPYVDPSEHTVNTIFCIRANMAAINFSLMDFSDFTIFMLTVLTHFYIKLILYICWIAGSILFGSLWCFMLVLSSS